MSTNPTPVELVITTWAYAHDINGAARNDLFKRLRDIPRQPASAAPVDELVESLRSWQGDMPGDLKRDLLKAADQLTIYARRVAELEEAGRKALNYIENTEGELSITLDSGDALRAALTGEQG